MSKSDPSDQSRINLTDSEDLIRKKVQKAKTDSMPFPESKNEICGFVWNVDASWGPTCYPY